MKKRDFVYIFYGLKIIVCAFAVIAFSFGVVWLFLHYDRFAIGFSVVAGFAVIILIAWAIGENKYFEEDNGGKK
jgi:uncharacterized membrane protein YqjE